MRQCLVDSRYLGLSACKLSLTSLGGDRQLTCQVQRKSLPLFVSLKLLLLFVMFVLYETILLKIRALCVFREQITIDNQTPRVKGRDQTSLSKNKVLLEHVMGGLKGDYFSESPTEQYC